MNYEGKVSGNRIRPPAPLPPSPRRLRRTGRRDKPALGERMPRIRNLRIAPMNRGGGTLINMAGACSPHPGPLPWGEGESPPVAKLSDHSSGRWGHGSWKERPEIFTYIAPMNRGGGTLINMAGRVPLTPALSLGERGNRRQSQSCPIIPAVAGATVHGKNAPKFLRTLRP